MESAAPLEAQGNALAAAPVPVLGAPPRISGFLGIVVLDTQFPRPLGDIGHPQSFGLPVNLRVMRGIWPAKVVQSAAGLRAGRVVPGLVNVMRALERDGARAITTSCGFLVLLQKELQAAVKVPLISSSLMLLPRLLREHTQVGVLTISAKDLGAEHLRSAGVPKDRLSSVLVQGVAPGTEFVTRILGNHTQMDLQQAQADVVAAAVALKARAPHLEHVVLECTNMPPYREAITAATGLKTWSLLDDERLFKPFRPATA